MDLGFVLTIAFGERLLLALDKKYMKLNNDKPLQFEAKINDEGQLVLVGPKLMKPTSTGVSFENG
ncbi:MAG: hypothetical protein HY222_06205 [Thaumarchaeota archaeon]|nr:hypothetical protein [Nitrososphaerota archaeon]